MRLSSSLLAASALAALAILGISASSFDGRAEAANSCSDSGTWRDTVREDGICCMPDHFHSGSGSGPTKAVAMARAAESWAGLVDFEYGSAFSRFSLAHGKTVSCSNSGGWSCEVEARPCRR